MSFLRAVLAGAALAVATGAASAADLARPYYGQPQAVQPTLLPAFTWTGLYVGAHAGYGFGQTKIGSLDTKFDTEGFIGGLQAGYNWQYQQFVYGIDGSITWSGADGSKVCGMGVNCSADVNWTGDLRLRGGYAFDRAMIYLAGGLAFADMDVRSTDGSTTSKGTFNDIGWTLGAGAEYAVTNNVTVGVEYKYSDFGKDNVNSYLTGVKFDSSALTLRANYKF